MRTRSWMHRLVAGGPLALATACATTYEPAVVARPAFDTARAAGPAEPRPAVPAQEPEIALPRDAGVEAYVRHGLEHNRELRAAFERWQASLERVSTATALPDPKLTYAEFIEEIQTRTGPQERRFGLSQAFPWPGVLEARGRVAKRRSDVMLRELEAKRLAVAEAVAVAHPEYSFLGTHVRITGEVLELLRRLEPTVQARIQAGGKQEDLLRLQVEIGKLEDELAGLRKLKPALSTRLAAAMSHPGRALLPEPDLREPETVAPAVDDVLDRALAENPRLRTLREELERSVEEVELAKYAGKPDFMVGVDYFETGSALMPGAPGSGDDPLALTFSVSLPIWAESYSASRRAARAELRGARERIADAELRLLADLEAELYRLDDAARRIALYRDSLLPRARETLELTLASYRSGDASLLDVIDSERSQLDFELSYWRACREHNQSSARLKTLLGEELR